MAGYIAYSNGQWVPGSEVKIDPMDRGFMVGDVVFDVKRNEHLRAEVGDFTIHQFVTRGPGRRAWSLGQPTVGVRIGAIAFNTYAQAYAEGMHGAITRTQSYTPESVDPKVKHYSRMNFNLAESWRQTTRTRAPGPF